MKLKLAITGPVASGKSFVLRIFKERGFRTISADFLEKILHPEMKKKILDFLKKHKKVAVENALLFEMNMEKNFDRIICVVPARSKENFFIHKKGLSREKFNQIKKMQLSPSLKIRKSHFVIKNTGRKRDIKRKVEEILKSFEKS